MNRHSPIPEANWPSRPRNTQLRAEPVDSTPAPDQGFDDLAARLAGPGRDLQQTMTAMVRSAVAQSELTH